MNGELIIKPTIQHFRLVEETEKKIRAFKDSFIDSILLTPDELIDSEKTKWIYFKTKKFKKCQLPEELVEKLCIKDNKYNQVYVIYPALVPDFGGYVPEADLIDIDRIMSDVRLFRKRKLILKLIDEKVIIPIFQSDYHKEEFYYNNLMCRFKLGNYVRKYKLDLDYYEKRFKRDVELLREQAKNILNGNYYRASKKYIVNKYGHPIPVFLEKNRKATKIEVNREKGCINLITDIDWSMCIISVDIKTNSIIRFGRKLKREVYDETW